MANALPIRENGKEIYVQGLSEYKVDNIVDTLELLKYVRFQHNFNIILKIMMLITCIISPSGPRIGIELCGRQT